MHVSRYCYLIWGFFFFLWKKCTSSCQVTTLAAHIISPTRGNGIISANSSVLYLRASSMIHLRHSLQSSQFKSPRGHFNGVRWSQGKSLASFWPLAAHPVMPTSNLLTSDEPASGPAPVVAPGPEPAAGVKQEVVLTSVFKCHYDQKIISLFSFRFWKRVRLIFNRQSLELWVLFRGC